MEVLEVTAGQFRERQKNFLEKADNGSRVIITRRSKRSYVLTPVEGDEYEEHEDDSFVVTPELLAQIERAEQQMREGKVTVCRTVEENLKFLDSL